MATILENVYTLSAHLEDAYTALENKGATIPQQKNATNLSATIDSVPAGGGFTIDDLLAPVGTEPKDLVINVAAIGNASTSDSGGAYNLFKNRPPIVKSVDFPNLTSIGTQGCQNMFVGQTSLTEVKSFPKGPIGANGCSGMLSACTSLTSIPDSLPATTLGNASYANMFADCTSLTKAPALPATTLSFECYYYMFKNCTSLSAAPELPVETL